MESNHIGDKITAARKAAGLSQAQLAEKLFISPQAVGKWERGESTPDILTVNQLAKILNVDLNYFSDAPTREAAAAGDGRSGSAQASQQDGHKPAAAERRLLTSFSGNALAKTDFAGISAPRRKFAGSDLRGADFSDADLSGSTFTGSDVREANFRKTNLTDCSFFALDLAGARFDETILVRTTFSSSSLVEAAFVNVHLVDVKLSTTDLTKTHFTNCRFSGVDFKASDLGGQCFDGLVFTDVLFDNAQLKAASFRGATLKNVSFRPSFALTNRYYKVLKTVCFDGATMDKLTWAALKGIGVDVSKAVTM